MNYISFLKINQYFVVLRSEYFDEKGIVKPTVSLPIVHENKIDFLQNGNDIPSSLLEKAVPQLKSIVSKQLSVFRTEKEIVLVDAQTPPSLLSRLSGVNYANTFQIFEVGLLTIANFRTQKRDTLFQAILHPSSQISQGLDAFMTFCFCDQYTLWVYNPFTDVFTCMAASSKSETNFITRKSNSSLFSFLEGSADFESRPPDSRQINNTFLKDTKTINRIRFSLDTDKTIGLLSLYSNLPFFEIVPLTRQYLSSYFRLKYLEVKQTIHSALRDIEYYFATEHSLGKLDQFLQGLVCKICAAHRFEACSIFIVDQRGKNLQLRATCDSDHTGIPPKIEPYDVAGNSLTALVFQTKMIQFSYCLDDDPRNSHIYDEKTSLKANNWIGVPIILGDTCMGVIRVANKFIVAEGGGRKIDNLQTSDFSCLNAISSNIAGILHIEEMLAKTNLQYETVEKRLKNLIDFNKVFLHEVRTPISKFNLAPVIIKQLLQKLELTNEQCLPIFNRLEDIRVMGERLSFITNTYYLSQMIQRIKIQKLSVMRDIVFPVINITRDYLKKMYGIHVSLNATSLEGNTVYGDKMFLNIVFNTLIDNAGKYTPESSNPIRISGQLQSSNQRYSIRVENMGLPIYEEETERIFENGNRGREPEANNIQGTGIGLYLSRTLMREIGGDLTLVSRSNPVVFEMLIPIEPVTKVA